VLTGCDQSNHSVRTVVKDREVTANVQLALLGSQKLKQLGIQVATRKGDVLLSGTVENRAQLERLKKRVYRVNGVQTIHDHLAIKNKEYFDALKI
jgi:hyperosmotically inducible protein